MIPTHMVIFSFSLFDYRLFAESRLFSIRIFMYIFIYIRIYNMYDRSINKYTLKIMSMESHVDILNRWLVEIQRKKSPSATKYGQIG